MSLFNAVEMAPRDPILGLTEQYNADTNPKKVNLGVGVYYDDNGKLPLLECVQKAEEKMMAAHAARGYLPIDGIAAYDAAVKTLVFGADSEPVKSGRVATVQKELGVSTEDVLKFTDNVALALRVAGTDATTASSALLQLSQALGSGTVHAEEFNSLLEGALPIVQAAAEGITDAGGSVSKLRQLVNEGKVSSEAFFRGFEAGAASLQVRAANPAETVSQAMTKLNNALLVSSGRLNDLTGASQKAAGYIRGFGDYVDALTGSATWWSA